MTRAEAEAIIALVDAAIGTHEVGSGALAYQKYAHARDKLRELAPAPPIVHYMRHGVTPCGMPWPPGGWPATQTWSSLWKDVDCPACLKANL